MICCHNRAQHTGVHPPILGTTTRNATVYDAADGGCAAPPPLPLSAAAAPPLPPPPPLVPLELCLSTNPAAVPPLLPPMFAAAAAVGDAALSARFATLVRRLAALLGSADDDVAIAAKSAGTPLGAALI